MASQDSTKSATNGYTLGMRGNGKLIAATVAVAAICVTTAGSRYAPDYFAQRFRRRLIGTWAAEQTWEVGRGDAVRLYDELTFRRDGRVETKYREFLPALFTVRPRGWRPASLPKPRLVLTRVEEDVDWCVSNGGKLLLICAEKAPRTYIVEFAERDVLILHAAERPVRYLREKRRD